MTILGDSCTILQTGFAAPKVATRRRYDAEEDEQPTTKKQDRRMQADREELAERIAHALPRDSKVEVQPGLVLTRLSSPTGPQFAVLEPWFCMIAQGAKDVMLGDEWFHYDPAHYLISTLGRARGRPGRRGVARSAVPGLAAVAGPLNRHVGDGRVGRRRRFARRGAAA